MNIEFVRDREMVVYREGLNWEVEFFPNLQKI
jgi:hypothetical protein